MAINATVIVNADVSPAEKSTTNLRKKIETPITMTLKATSLSQPLGRITGDVSEFTKSLSAASARVAAFGATSGAIYAVAKAISFTAKSVVEVDKELTELNTFLGVSTGQIKQFGNSLFDVAKDTASSFKDTANAAKEFARQGLSMEETLKRTSDALKLSRISGLGAEESVNALTTAVNSFSKEALTTSEVINKLINVDTKFAVSSKDLAEAISRVGSTAQESGVGIDQLNAAVTSAQQTTGRGGAVIGNALKTIFSRLRRPEVIDQLKDLGVAVKDQNGFLLNGIDVLKNYVAATQNLTEAEKAKSSEILGGIHQINVLNSLLNDVSKSNGIYARSLDASVNSTDEAIKKNEKLNESLSAILQKTSVLAQQKAVQFGTPALQPLIQRGTKLTQGALKLLGDGAEKKAEEEGVSLGEQIAKGVGQVLAGPGVLVSVGIALTIGKRLTKFLFEASRSLLGLTSESDKLLHIEQAISTTLKGNPELISQFLNKTITRTELERQILNLYNDQYDKLRQIKDISSTFSGRVRQAGFEASANDGLIKKPYVKPVYDAALDYLPFRKKRASGYLPDGFAQEVSEARSLGASPSVRPMVVNATINGKTGPVIANSEERIISNFAGTGETAIIPDYRDSSSIPNFAKGRNLIQRIGKKEIFARFQKHYEQGKDYAGFYSIHGEEFANKGLSKQDAKIYANITSAISPSVPDYVAAQFAAPIFNRYMKTKSTSVDDYLDLAPTKIVSRHKNLASLGLFGSAGSISNSGNTRDRDDARRVGLSKALRGADLGSYETAKTRHYARAIQQDKSAFPIDTNVIQAILGGRKPSQAESSKLVSLANEFARLHKIETGASGLQAAIFKSNSKHSSKYSSGSVRAALSGIGGRAGGYKPVRGPSGRFRKMTDEEEKVEGPNKNANGLGDSFIGRSLNTFAGSYFANSIVGAIPSVASGFADEGNVDRFANFSRYAPLAAAAANVGRSAYVGFKTGGVKGAVTNAGISAAASALPVYSGFSQGNEISQQVRTDKLQKEIDKSIKRFTLLTEDLSGLSQTLTSLDEAYSDPNIDPRIIAKLFKKQQDQLEKAIKANPGAASSILAAGTARQKQQALANTLEEENKQQNVSSKVFEYQSADPKKQTATAFQSLIEGIISQVDTSKISKEDLKSGDIKTILASAGLDKNPQAKSLFADPKVADYFTKALGVSKKISELTEKLISDTKEIRKPVQALINSNESKRTVRRATSEALSSGLDSIEKFSSSFGERANISAGRDIGLAKKQIALDSRFQIGVGAKINTAPEGAFKESLKKDIQDKAFSPELLATLNKTLPENATSKEKEVFGQIKGLLEEILREDQTNTSVANAQTSIQLKTLAIQERLTFGGGIKTSIDAGARVDSAKQTLRGALQYQLGGTLGSSSTQTAGLTNFAASLKDKYPGLLEGSKSVEGIEKKLTDLKFSDLRKSLLRDARTAGSIGQGGLAGDLLKGFNDIPGLRKIANTQARQGLGLAPTETGESISESRRFGRYNSARQRQESEAVANAEKGIEPQVGPKNEIYQKAVKDLQDSLSNALSNVGEIKINGNPVINVSGNTSGTSTLGNLYQQGKNALGLGSGEVTQAKGFIPNFASPLQDAVNREKSALSKRGIDAVPNFAKINVGQSRKLMNGSNPMGLAVTNSIDEPMGLASIGLASGGYIPNFAAFGESVASKARYGATIGKLYTFDHNRSGYRKVNRDGSVDTELIRPKKLPRGAQVISTELSESGGRRSVLGLKDPNLTKLDELKLPGVARSQPIDRVLSRLNKQGKLNSATLLAEINKISGGQDTVVKTAFGDTSFQGLGVFGVKNKLSTQDAKTIIRRFKKGTGRGFFTQAKVPLSHGELRVHVAVDDKGNVKIVKGATILKATQLDPTSKASVNAYVEAGLSEKDASQTASSFKKSGESAAVRAIRSAVKRKGITNAFFGVDVGATTLDAANRAGVDSREFYSGGRGRVGTIILETNPSERIGSSGYVGGGLSESLVKNIFGQKPAVPKRLLSGLPTGFRQHPTLYSSARQFGLDSYGRAKSFAGESATATSSLFGKISGATRAGLSGVANAIPSSVRKAGGGAFRGLGALSEGYEAYESAQNGDALGALMHGATSAAFGLGKAKIGGSLIAAASAAKLVKNIANAKNYSIASDFSDILSGSEEYGEGGLSDALGSISNAVFGGQVGLAAETFKIGYRAGNVLESKGKLGDKLAEIGGYTSGEDRLAKFGYGRSITKKDVIEGRESASEFIKQKRLYLEQTLGSDSGRISSILNEDLSQIRLNKSGGFVPNFSFAREKMSIMSSPDYAGHRNAVPNYSKHYSNVVKNSAEIEVPATEVYNRMGLFGAKPKNSSEQYAILNPAQQKSLGYAQGFVPNFAGNDFMEKLSVSIKEAISSAFEGGIPQGSSNSNVIHINDNSSYHGASQVGSIKKFLMDQFPKELGKYGPDFLAS